VYHFLKFSLCSVFFPVSGSVFCGNCKTNSLKWITAHKPTKRTTSSAYKIPSTMSAISDVIIVGAGAAGLTAAYTLVQAGLSVRVLEANSHTIGGRMRKDTSLGLPIDLGAEWIETHPSVLKEIVSHTLPPFDMVQHIPFYAEWDGHTFNTTTYDYVEYLWVNYTWQDFFTDHVASFFKEDVSLGCAVNKINYATSRVSASCHDGRSYHADRVIVTASMKVLQDDIIHFNPALPLHYRTALNQFSMGPAVKAFIEFDETFYPKFLEVMSDMYTYSLAESSPNYYERMFYDEMYGESTTKHILGMFAYGRAAEQYVNASSSAAIVKSILDELNQIFHGEATASYVRHVVKNWAADPFVRTGYTRWVHNWRATIQTMQHPVSNKVFFAGEALPVDLENWGFVHGAALSGKMAAQKILALPR
jgi:monoamine oxidase